MDWCGSSTPRTPEYRTMNEERQERVIARPQGGDTKGLCPSIPWIDREGGQSFWFFHVVKELNNCSMDYLIEHDNLTLSEDTTDSTEGIKTDCMEGNETDSEIASESEDEDGSGHELLIDQLPRHDDCLSPQAETSSLEDANYLGMVVSRMIRRGDRITIHT